MDWTKNPFKAQMLLFGIGFVLAVASLILGFGEGKWIYEPLFWAIFPAVNGLALGAFAWLVISGWDSLKQQEALGRLPLSAESIDRNEEGSQIVAVTRHNGECLTVELPADYDPRSDGGELLIKLINPELYETGL